jgi:hypothetical protein
MATETPLAPDYTEARRRFLEAAGAAGAELTSHPFDQTGPVGEEVAVDVARLGPLDAERVLLIVSGTHGVEGFAGSECQYRWLEGRGAEPMPDGLAMVFVHAHNPYGFAWVRRVNEDNVDLNRNYLDGATPPANPGYEELAGALSPVDLSPAVLQEADATLLDYGARNGMDALQAAVSGGQYTHPDGVFYGGTGPVRSQQLMREILQEHTDAADQVVILDLHTGLGAWGEVEVITHEVPGSPGFAEVERWWGAHPIGSSTSGDSVSAPLTGEWMAAASNWLAPRQVIAAALEWGTVDPITVLLALRADNWLHTRGDPTGPDAAPIKEQLRAAFAPDDPAWFERVYDCFVDVVTEALRARD